MQYEVWLETKLETPPRIEQLNGCVFTQDSGSLLLGVSVYKNGKPVTLDGTIMGYAVRGDGATVTMNGSKEDNKAWVVLPESALAKPGILTIAIRNVSSQKTVLCACRMTVIGTSTDTIIDPGHVIPSIEELLAQIETMEEAIIRSGIASSLCEDMTVSATAVSGSDPSVTKTMVYTAVTPPLGANPKNLGYYELVSGNYVRSTDTTASGEKTYYLPHFNLQFGMVSASVSTQVTEYKVDDSGSTIPTSGWQSTMPSTITQGKFLWMRHTITWNNAQTSVLYSVSRQGIDGSGAVNTVNGINPDSNGNVAIPVDAFPTASSTNLVKSGGVKSAIDAHFPVSLAEGGTGGTSAPTARSSLGVALKPITVDFGTISALPDTVSATGITADMIPIAWELDKDAFDSDLTVTTGAGTVTISGTIHTGASSSVKITFCESTQVSGT